MNPPYSWRLVVFVPNGSRCWRRQASALDRIVGRKRLQLKERKDEQPDLLQLDGDVCAKRLCKPCSAC